MAIFLNPDNANFNEAVHSKIYVDKTGLIEYTNSVLLVCFQPQLNSFVIQDLDVLENP